MTPRNRLPGLQEPTKKASELVHLEIWRTTLQKQQNKTGIWFFFLVFKPKKTPPPPPPPPPPPKKEKIAKGYPGP
jgi:hypothetical protein